MKKTTWLLLCILMLQHYSATAQSFAINTDGSAANASALLDVKSSIKGVLIPRLSTTQRTSILSPAEGLLVYDSTANSFWVFDGTTWQEIVAGNNTLWKKNGNDIYNNNTGNVGIGISTPLSLIQVKGGAVLFDSTIGGTPVSGSGTRFMWIPAKKALRAGSVVGTDWDDANIGLNSIGLGYDMRATGFSSIAIGTNALALADQAISIGSSTAFVYRSTAFGAACTASGTDAVVMGYACTAAGLASFAMGFASGAYGNRSFAMGDTAYAMADNSVAMGNKSRANAVSSVALGDSSVGNGIASLAAGYKSIAGGNYSVALGDRSISGGAASLSLGFNNTASAANATAIGASNTASGLFSTAMGNQATAINQSAVAIGYNVIASGRYSFATGTTNNSKSYGGFVAGLFNDLTAAADANNINSLNRIFQIGNGTGPAATGNAMTVLQNGNTGIGVLNPKHNLVVAKEICVDDNDANDGDTSNALRFGAYYTGEAIGSKRTLGGNHWGMDFYTNYLNRMVITNAGKVGIGVYSPARLLSVATDIGVDENNANSGTIANSLHFGASNSGEAIASNRVGGNQWGLDFYTNSANRLSISNSGNVGIGTVNPVVPLNFAPTLGDKIALWTNGTTHYGFGIQPSLLQVYTEYSGADIAFGYGNSAAFTENVRIKGNGTTITKGLQVSSNGTVITKMQSGSTVVGSSATAQKVVTLIFPVAFVSGTPRVFVTARNEPFSSFTDAFSVSIRSINATSVTLNIQRTDSITGWGQQLYLDWFAVE